MMCKHCVYNLLLPPAPPVAYGKYYYIFLIHRKCLSIYLGKKMHKCFKLAHANLQIIFKNDLIAVIF